MRQRALVLTATMALAVAALAGCTSSASSTSLPNSMASTGDSITRAFDLDWFHVLVDAPQDSWSTGNAAGVTSQYRHLLARNPAISGHAFNDAKTGAKMSDLDGQVLAAAGQRVQYLTVLTGANDLCTSSASTMTPTATFAAQFQRALADFTAKDPAAKVFVSSIPNIYQLWNVLHSNPAAASTWRTFGICPSMLAATNTSADRQKVVDQEAADNAALRSVCAQVSQCRWDNYAAYNFNFRANDVSTVDYFHPNLNGQNALAAVSWAAGYWGP